VWFGGEVTFTLKYSTFSNLVAGNVSGGISTVTYGGAIYSQSNKTGLRYLINLTFISNAAEGSKGING
jgi:hypothetical protein